MTRLDEQIRWYSRRSSANLWWFRILKVIELVAAAMIPFLAARPTSDFVSDPAIITGLLGVLIVVLESLQGLFQFQSNWITYRSTCEDLKREKYLWIAGAGPYADIENSERLLAERIESVISAEHARWAFVQKNAGRCSTAAEK